jgi:short subunit dehydrogenase-like uncharacterized protein
VTDWSRKQEIQQAGITAVPGAGFDVVPTDRLARYVASNLERPVSLVIALRGLDSASQGTLRTAIRQVSQPVLCRREGAIVVSAAGGGVRHGQAANHRPAVAVRTIMGVSVVGCGDEHKENESEKEPKERRWSTGVLGLYIIS